MQDQNSVFQLSDEKREQIRRSQELLNGFYSVIRTGLYHSANNSALLEPSKAFTSSQHWFVEQEQGEGALVVNDGLVFAGSMRVRLGARQLNIVGELEKFLKQRQIGGIQFCQPMNDTQVRIMATTLVRFRPQPGAENGVEGLSALLEEEGLAPFIKPVPPVEAKSYEELDDVNLSAQGQAVQHFAKTYTVLSAMFDGKSNLARASLQRMVRNLSDFPGDVSDMLIGLSLVSAQLDMPLRSMVVMLVAIQIADQFGASRDTIAQIGDITTELAVYDSQLVESAGRYGTALSGVAALRALLPRNQWPLGVMRHSLALGTRYMPFNDPMDSTIPKPNSLGQIIRLACDYVDLVVPTPMANAEAFLEEVPQPPHEALLLLRDYVGTRYSEPIYKALVRGIGLLPVGTYVKLADGNDAVIRRRTTDPLTFIAVNASDRREREAAFVRGPNQITRVVVGSKVLELRSELLMGEDHEAFLETITRISGR